MQIVRALARSMFRVDLDSTAKETWKAQLFKTGLFLFIYFIIIIICWFILFVLGHLDFNFV